MLLVEGSSETWLFKLLTNRVFPSAEVQKDNSYEVHLFFENVQNWIEISKMLKKIQKIFFVSEIIASESIAIYCVY